MQRRFNYTDRLRLLRAEARFFAKEDAGRLLVSSQINVDERGLPSDSLVYVEAYRQTFRMRFACGTAGTIVQLKDCELIEFDSLDNILFRVKISSPGTKEDPHGRLLAEADSIPLTIGEEKNSDIEPLLPTVGADLGDEIWRMNFEGIPTLQINKSASSDWRQLGLDPVFRALVYPAALSQILTKIIIHEKHRDLTDPDDINSRWVRFASEVLGVGEPPALDEDTIEAIDWIESAVTAFSRKHGLLRDFVIAWGEEGNKA